MDCFYIITNKLKDKDYAITSQIEQYIQSSGKKCFLSEKDSEGHIIPGTVPKEAEAMLTILLPIKIVDRVLSKLSVIFNAFSARLFPLPA